MIKVSWNEFLIGSGISLGGALLVGYAATTIIVPITKKKTAPEQTVAKVPVKAKAVVKQTPEETPEPPEAVATTKEQADTVLIPLPKADDQFPLQLGSKGGRVWKLRAYLLRNHGADGIISDEFTLKTKQQVLKYLKVDRVDESLYNKLIDPITMIR